MKNVCIISDAFRLLIGIYFFCVLGLMHAQIKHFAISAKAQGFIEVVNNIANVSILSKSKNVYKAEFQAGYIQGKLQKSEILAARDNTWDGYYLLDPSHSFPQTIPPSRKDLLQAQQILTQNLDYTLNYIDTTSNQKVKHNMRRLMYRIAWHILRLLK